MSPKIPTSEHKSTSADERLGELMLFVAKRCENDPKFGATKLNKIIVFSDVVSFLRTGKSITGGKIMRLPNGPAPRRLLPVRNALIEAKRAVVQSKTLLAGKRQDRLIALDEPRVSLFSADDIATVTEMIETLSDHFAKDVSDFSHEWPGWQLAEDGEDIPLEAAFILSLNANEVDAARGRELAAIHGWGDGL